MEEVAKQWNSRVKISSGEAITPFFLQAAVLAWDFLLKKESTRSLIVQAEETFGKKTPWDSVHKLGDLVKKSLRETETIDWILMCVNDLVLNKILRPQDLSGHALTGRGQGGKG